MFNGTSVLESELKEVLELSRRQLASNGDGKQLSDLLGTSGSDGDEALLGAAERVAEAQPVLPVLARRIAFARRLLHFIERGSSALGDQEEQQLPALAKGVSAARQGEGLASVPVWASVERWCVGMCSQCVG